MARPPYSQIRGPGPGHWTDRQAVKPLNRFLARAVEKQGQQCPEVSSTAIQSVGYNSATARLTVTFNSGRSYAYFDVGNDTYRAFCNADSKGRYFNSSIRDKYAYARLG